MNASKILIAEDEPYVSRVLKLVLQQEGYEVTCANNGKLALEVYKNERPDIVITDVKMPHMTGRQLAESIRQTDDGREVPIIVMTSTLESENREWVHNVGNVSFMGKPVSPRDLIRVISNHFTHSKAS